MMRGSLFWLATSLSLVIGGCSSSESVDKEQQIVMELMGKDDLISKLGYDNSQRLEPYDFPQEKLLDEPVYKSDKPIYYAAKFGDSEDNVFSFILDESGTAGNGYYICYVDLNNDNRIDSEKECIEIKAGTRIGLAVTSGGVTAPYYVSLRALTFPNTNNSVSKICLELQNSSFYGGKAIFEGKPCKIAIADLNSNGLFNDPEQGVFQGDRFFVFFNQKEEQAYNILQAESFSYGRYTRIHDKWYSIVASPDGSRMAIRPAKPPLGKIEAPANIANAFLTSDEQSLNLKLEKKADDAVAGTYRVKSVYLLPEGTSNEIGLSGQFAENGPEVIVKEGETTQLFVGTPLAVTIQSTPQNKNGTIEFRLVLTGVAGEKYLWRKKSSWSPSPMVGFRILDESGKIIASKEFEYG